MKTCPDCNGDGVVEKGTDDEQRCPTCGGCGFVPDDDDGQEEVIKTIILIEHSRLFSSAYELACELRRYPRINETPSDVVAAVFVAPPLASVGLNPVALMKFVHGV